MIKTSINDVKSIKLSKNSFDNKKLFVFQNSSLPFKLKRTFFVYDNNNIRGNHAHIKCNQLLICIKGEVKVIYKDGVNKNFKILNDIKFGLWIPPGIWCSQIYGNKKTILMVICDREFEENDYIRNFKKYLKIKKITE